MSAAEFQAAIPEPRIILGVRLLPLSLGRYRLLKRFECPFVADEPREIPTQEMIRELIFALILCGQSCADFHALLYGNSTAMDSIRKFFHLPTGIERECRRFGKNLRKLIRRTRHFNILESFAEFKDYLAEAQKTPWHVSRTDSHASESVSHWSHNIEVTLRSHVSWSAEEIEEQPMQKALCDFFKFIEGEGSVRLISHEAWDVLATEGEANGLALAAMFAEMGSAEHRSASASTNQEDPSCP